MWKLEIKITDNNGFILQTLLEMLLLNMFSEPRETNLISRLTLTLEKRYSNAQQNISEYDPKIMTFRERYRPNSIERTFY